jgi:hypothetical protein
VDGFFVRNQAIGTSLRARVLTPFRQNLGQLEISRLSRYNVLKLQFRIVNKVIKENPGLKDKQLQSLVDLIQVQVQSDFNAGVANIVRTQPEGESRSRSWTEVVKRVAGMETSTPTISHSLPYMDDITFIRKMADVVEHQPVYCDVAAEIKSAVIVALKQKLDRICGQVIRLLRDNVLQNIETEINRHFTERQLREEASSWQMLRMGMQKSLSSSPSTSRFVIISNV